MVTIFGLLCKSDCKSNIDFLLFEGPVLENGMSKYLEENTQQCQLKMYLLALLRNMNIIKYRLIGFIMKSVISEHL